MTPANFLTTFYACKTMRHPYIYICACHKWQMRLLYAAVLSACAPSRLVPLRSRRAVIRSVLVACFFSFFLASGAFSLAAGRPPCCAGAFNPPPTGARCRIKKKKMQAPARVRVCRPAVPVVRPVARCSAERRQHTRAASALRARTYIYIRESQALHA